MKKMTLLKAARQNCLDCSGGSPKEVKFCHSPSCPMYPWRLGKNPNRKGVGNT